MTVRIRKPLPKPRLLRPFVVPSRERERVLWELAQAMTQMRVRWMQDHTGLAHAVLDYKDPINAMLYHLKCSCGKRLHVRIEDHGPGYEVTAHESDDSQVAPAEVGAGD